MAQRKYRADNLARMFLKAADLRNDMLAAGFTDNGGAIHSAERIMDLLGLILTQGDLSHRNKLKTHPLAECSVAAHSARQRGETVLIEHVAPLRELTRAAIKKIEGLQNPAEDLLAFVRDHYRLVLLTPAETTALKRSNRSRMDPLRLEGIPMIPRNSA